MSEHRVSFIQTIQAESKRTVFRQEKNYQKKEEELLDRKETRYTCFSAWAESWKMSSI